MAIDLGHSLLHNYNIVAWREFSKSLKVKKYATYGDTTRFVELHFAGNLCPVDEVIDALEARPSDDVIVVSEKAFKELRLHCRYNGEPFLRQLEDGLCSYMQHIVLRCEDGIRVQSCCSYQSCGNYYHLDFIVGSIDIISVIE